MLYFELLLVIPIDINHLYNIHHRQQAIYKKNSQHRCTHLKRDIDQFHHSYYQKLLEQKFIIWNLTNQDNHRRQVLHLRKKVCRYICLFRRKKHFILCILERDTPILAEPEARKNVEVEQELQPIIFLEPKIISQPILYSIVGAKTNPTPEVQPVQMDQEMPSPIFHSITGDPHRPNIDMSVNTLDVATPVIHKSPILYTLIGSPRLQVRFQEPIKQVSQPNAPNLYSIVGSPHPIIPTQEPITKSSQQSSPSLYSIVGNPTLTPHTTQVNTLSLSPSTQPVKANHFQPAPILYTVVGETHVPNNISKENYPPPAPAKKHTNNVKTYTVAGDSSIPPSITPPRKIQPLQQQQPQQVSAPLLYTLLGQPKSPSKEDMDIRPKYYITHLI
jgi:hypothetical protein